MDVCSRDGTKQPRRRGRRLTPVVETEALCNRIRGDHARIETTSRRSDMCAPRKIALTVRIAAPASQQSGRCQSNCVAMAAGERIEQVCWACWAVRLAIVV